MTKINITSPFDTVTYKVIYGDTDAGGVMYYGSYMRLLEIGRNEYMRNIINLPYSYFENSGIRFPVAEMYTRYISPAFYDDTLLIKTCIGKATRKTITFHYEITKEDGQKKVLIASTLHMAINNEMKSISFPDALLKKLSEV